MTKWNLFVLLLLILAEGCGQQSSIKTAVYADDLSAPRTMKIVIPLSEDTIASFDTPIKSVTPILRGIVAPLMNIGAAVGQGKMRLSLDQPLPEIPTDIVKGVKVKRMFFYMEPTAQDAAKVSEHNQEESEKLRKQNERAEKAASGDIVAKSGHVVGNVVRASTSVIGGASGYLGGALAKLLGLKKAMSFDFIDHLAVVVSSEKMNNQSSWMPSVTNGDMSSNEKLFLKNIVKSPMLVTNQNDNKIVLIKYSKSHAEEYLREDHSGKIFIISTDNPKEVRKEIESDSNLSTYYTRIHTLNKSLLIELVRDPVVEENFKLVFNQRLSDLVNDIKPCDREICRDFNVADVNLIPTMSKGNAMKIDIYINPNEVPASFQLKGFMEIELTYVVLPKSN